MSEEFLTKIFPNGLTLLGQKKDDVSSAAMTLLVNCGSVYDPSALAGSSSVAAEWLFRGAGDRDSRALNDAMDALGCQHDINARSAHLQMSAALLGRNFSEALDIYADILLRPRLEDETFGPSRDLVVQDLASLEDEPARKCNIMLREKFFPYPLARCSYGCEETLAAMTPAAVRNHIQAHLVPDGVILAVAGKFDWDAICEQVENRLGGWARQAPQRPALTPQAGGVTHIQKDSSQTHIALAYKSVVCRDEDYYPARIAEAVLSRGMGSRLFTEVREKRGLCYHVSASYTALKDYAGIFVYAGTRPDIAQQTLDVTVSELRRLAEGIEAEEITRAKTQLRSSLIMQGESTSARAGTMASDWYHLGHLRSMEDLSQKLQAVTEQEIMDYLRQYPAENFTILTIGPEPLDTSKIEQAGGEVA